ncbi:extracellular solute-binding protein [Ruminiclostridium cellobioparum]|uniref:ABC-type sugar transport system, periplasmic component n=1 Tax=Ruminiclostridium cellobioparum subsp. termitidis CT1112 TaxID=1195236 RepID=S0FIL0_RUMCE|nr:extracellular solute-binding protein [Ruminiclostridium cellobioparum]EMS69996.1 ABC-type sugar transport system, periplasmic component [Ruminiclostridium cellobioparum subsp. termitidis CT1112]
MKRNWFRVYSLILVATMIIPLAACGSNTKQNTEVTTSTVAGSTTNNSASGDSSWDKFKGTTLTYWVEFNSSYIQSLEENHVMQEIEKRTGIKINYTIIPSSQVKETFNLMIASGDYPDLISDKEYKGGGLQAVKDGVYLKLNDYITKYAPNYTAVMASNPDIARQSKEDDGTIWSFKILQSSDEPSWAGPVIRKDYLDELGLKMPETIDDWHTALTAFKDKKKVDIPMLLPYTKFNSSEVFAGTYGASTSQFLNKDGKVVYGPTEPGYKDFLTLMNQWYKEGLIDKDFATRDDKSLDAQITSGKAGSCAIAFYGSFAPYELAAKATNSKYDLAPASYPVINKGDDVSKVLHIGNKNWNSKNGDVAISTNCKNIEAAVKWLDYRYSDEGFMLFNYGVEGEGYNWADGALDNKYGPEFFPKGLQEKIKTKHPEFTELLTKNPDGVDFDTAKDKYKGYYIAQLRNPLANVMSNAVYDAMDVWSKPGKDYMFPPVSKTAEEAQVESEIYNQVNTYKDEMTFKFIMGVEPISNFDKYVSQVKSLGIDKLIKAKRDQLDRYLKR